MARRDSSLREVLSIVATSQYLDEVTTKKVSMQHLLQHLLLQYIPYICYAFRTSINVAFCGS